MAQKLFRVLSSSSEHSEQSYPERGMGGESHRWWGALCFKPAGINKNCSEYAQKEIRTAQKGC